MLHAIPAYLSREVQSIPSIVDNKESLIQIGDSTHPRIFIHPVYYSQRIPSSLKMIYIREAVFQKICEALQLLPTQYSFILYDGYRPIHVQAHLYQQYLNTIQQQNLQFSEQQVIDETRKYVAFPTMNQLMPPPHITGGAIDLSLADEKGVPLDMGTAFDYMHESSATRYFESTHSANKEARMNRRVLYNVMTAVGFTNYEEEWWHYDYGNTLWAKRHDQKVAQYGVITCEIDNNLLKEYRYI